MPERILVISPEVLYPTNAGGRAVVLARCRVLREAGFRVDLLVFHREPVLPADAARHAEVADEVVFVARRTLAAATLAAPFVPYQVSGRHLPPSAVERLERMPRPDLVIAEQEWTVDAAARLFKDRPVPILLASHNDEAAYYADQFHAERGLRRLYLLLESTRITSALHRLRRRVAAVVTLAPQDEHVYSRRPVRTIPHPLPEAAEATLKTNSDPSQTVLFVGALDMPHAVEGLVWYTREVWPRIRRRCPDAVLVVAGRRAPAALQKRLALTDGVRFLGEVSDLEPLYRDATCFVNPVFLGSGVNIKLAEPIGRGIPCVTTGVGARGYEALGDALLVADDWRSFADTCCTLLLNPAEAHRVSRMLRLRSETMRLPTVVRQWRDAARAALITD